MPARHRRLTVLTSVRHLPLAALLLLALIGAAAHAAPRPDALPLEAGTGDATPVRVEAAAARAAALNAAAPIPLPASALRVGATFVVSTAADTGAGTLRAAITAANAAPGLDAIVFAIPGGGVHTIAVKTSLPVITSPVVLDATTQPGYAGTPVIELTYGGAVGGIATGLYVYAGSSVVRGFIINGFPGNGTTTGYGLWLDVAGGNVIEGNWIGLDASGAAAKPNAYIGITIRGASGYNRIGGFTAQARNVIAGNASTGLAVISGTPGHNRIAGNYFGLNATGTAPVSNGANNVFVAAPDDTIGGLESGARNVIAASGTGFPDVYIAATAPRTIVQGNFIGLDATGTIDMGSPSNGINVRSSDNVIGDATIAGRNVISGMDKTSIYVFGASALRNRIVGNYIGTDVTGLLDRGDWNGITLDTTNDNTIGGVTPGERNVISGHPGPGISLISGATGNRILGNWIGLNASGGIPLPNGSGIRLNNSGGNRIGGSAPGEGNVISGNLGFGVELQGAATNNTRVSGNRIGTTSSGLLGLGNGAGVFVSGFQDTIGGATAAEANTIAFNGGVGVLDSAGTNVWIARNVIHSNSGLGVDLFPTGLTPNDSLDTDAGGNGLQNYPAIDSVMVIANGQKIAGHLDSKPSTTYTISVFKNAAYDPSHFGEGQTFLTSGPATTDAAGHATFNFNVPYMDAPAFVTATATDATGNTSEFSQAFCTSDEDEDGLPDCWETQGWGLDANSDGVVDVDLYARGARPDHKDVFVEIDAMLGMAPAQAAIDSVVAAFTRVPESVLSNPDNTPGIALHAELSDVFLPVQDLPNPFVDQAPIKATWFGTAAERASSNRYWLLEAKRMVYRYGLWCHTAGTGDEIWWSGRAEKGFPTACDDFLVTLSIWPAWRRDNPMVHAGTFMHELGHTLGLHHGGGDDTHYKPNYISVMNYSWQLPDQPWVIPGSWRLAYSPVALAPLDETSLDETQGLGLIDPVYPVMAVPFNDSTYSIQYAILMPGAPVDWSGDGVAANPAFYGDPNHVGESTITPNVGETLTGYADWPNLIYSFRNSPAFRTIPPGGPAPALRAAADTTYRELSMQEDSLMQTLPPPRPYGRFVMDGQLDASALLVALNGGAHLWAEYWKGQLYLATDATGVNGADLCVLVAGSRGALRAAPLAKAGQVGAYRAMLTRRGTSHATSWSDDTERDLGKISADSSATVLEGVIDLRLLSGERVPHAFVALARYDTTSHGALLLQAPAGNADANVDGAEYVELVTTASVVTPRPHDAAFALFAAGPNPVHGDAQLRLTLPAAADVDVSVLDLAGRRVATLAHERMSAGEHALAWAAADGHGTRRAPGVYFVVARVAGETRSARIVVLR